MGRGWLGERRTAWYPLPWSREVRLQARAARALLRDLP